MEFGRELWQSVCSHSKPWPRYPCSGEDGSQFQNLCELLCFYVTTGEKLVRATLRGSAYLGLRQLRARAGHSPLLTTETSHMEASQGLGCLGALRVNTLGVGYVIPMDSDPG